jgi:hypothetical protein
MFDKLQLVDELGIPGWLGRPVSGDFMKSRLFCSLLGCTFVALACVSSASGQQRTFVSGLGNDGNPCSRLAPCRNFAQAISQTNAGGEVIVLDSAGYGAFAITKSVSIIAPPGVYAGISVFSGDGIDINAGVFDTVILRGLTVNNQGSMGNGVVFNTGLKLHVEGCVINGFSSGGSAGVSLLAGGAQAEVIDSLMRGNFDGIFVKPSSGTLQATIDHVRLEGNNTGLSAEEGSQVAVTNSVAANNITGVFAFSSTAGSTQMNVESTVASGNGTGIGAEAQGTGPVQLNVARCVISGNFTRGIGAESDSTGVATVRVSSSTVTGNVTGLEKLGAPALLLSRGDNTVEGNTTDTSGTIGSYTGK